MAYLFENYRRYQRYSICTVAQITCRGESNSEKLTTRVNTISQGGMGFYADVFLKKSTPVTIELMGGADGRSDVFEGKIASICSLEKDYFVGVSFDSEISHDRFVEIIG